ncbi:hypothetical protein ACFL6S_37775, partial [Candidatus Poribacteria bacterium]
GTRSTHMGDVTAVGDVIIEAGNTIVGNVTAGGKVKNEGTVIGKIAELAGVEAQPLPRPSFEAGGANVTVRRNGSRRIPPGSYGEVQVKHNGTLELSSGFYFMESLKMGMCAVLETVVADDELVVVNVVKELDFAESSEVMITQCGEDNRIGGEDNRVGDDNTDGGAHSDKVLFQSLKGAILTIGVGAKVMGTIIAPDAVVTLKKDALFKGTIFAKTLHVNDGVTLLAHGSEMPSASCAGDRRRRHGRNNAGFLPAHGIRINTTLLFADVVLDSHFP